MLTDAERAALRPQVTEDMRNELRRRGIDPDDRAAAEIIDQHRIEVRPDGSLAMVGDAESLAAMIAAAVGPPEGRAPSAAAYDRAREAVQQKSRTPQRSWQEAVGRPVRG